MQSEQKTHKVFYYLSDKKVGFLLTPFLSKRE